MINTSHRGWRSNRTNGPQDTEHQDTNHHTAENPNVNGQGDTGHTPPNTPTMDQDLINQLVNQCIAEQLAESNHSNTSAGTPLPNRTHCCTYKEFRFCGPIEIGGTEEVVYLMR